MSLWQLAKWSQQASKLPEPSQFPPLQDPLTGEPQTEAREKTTTLETFFPDSLPTDLADIQDYCYPELLERNPNITLAKLWEVIVTRQ